MEMGEVFETSSQPINGNHGELSMEADCQSKVSPVNGFSFKAHTNMRSCLTKECKCILTEEDADENI
jgi:hypothetical protein